MANQLFNDKTCYLPLQSVRDKKNPNANTCIKLAAYYTILDHITGNMPDQPIVPGMSFSGPTSYHGDSDFAKAIYGKDPDAMWAIMDELMTALQVVDPRLYDSVMRKIAE